MENVKPVDIHKRLFLIYGNETIEISSARCWVLQVKSNKIGKGIISIESM